MPSPPLLPSDIADLLGSGGTVVTGNQRAARTLRLAFDRACQSRGLASWQPPAIFAWETWTASLYRQLLLDGNATRILLNRTQELQVWRSVLEADSQWRSLQTVDSLADMAADAWQRLCAYRGQQRLKSLGVSGDTRNFQRWAQAFGRRCTSDEYLSAAELEEALIVSAGRLASDTREVLLLGFDSKTPAQQAFIDALRSTGVRIEDHQASPPATHLHLAATETPDEELTQAARRIRGLLADRTEATIAVIVPSLAAERREIDRVFRHLLAPELEDITATAASPYEFSLGQPLAGTALVAIALEILRFASGAAAITSVSRILLSPYFAARQNELSARAEFDAFELRHTRALRPEISLKRLIALVSRSTRVSKLAGLLNQLRSLERSTAKLLFDPAPKQRSWSDWAEAIRTLLHASGWPGSSALDSVAFQTREKFESALDELATLDFEGTRPNFAEAVAQLEAILQRTLFAPESRQAPIQIMSPLEAAGSRFDAICLLRASDLEWPVRPAIHPLLGWRLQRELAMPGSDALLDAAYAQRVTDRIAGTAETVVFSYARQTEVGCQRASPLLANLRLQPLAAFETLPAPTPLKLELFEDDLFIPLTNLTVSGGANVLKLQAACGFRAFAEHRLRSTPVETPESGMDALERGIIVHAALEHLWSDLRTQAALRALTPEQRAAQLSRSVEHSLGRAAASLASDQAANAASSVSAEPWPAAYLGLQRERLHLLLAPWLEEELERPPFEVAQREQRETFRIGPLTMDLRVDRVDRTWNEDGGPGGSVLIDYKTGEAKPSAWATDRPDEPQLPLYAVLREPDSLAAVAFANIRAGKDMALNGYAAREGVLAGSAKLPFGSLEGQLEDWRRVLTRLAEEFAQGDARVRPKSYPATCKHCDQRLLCRLDPTLLAADEDDAGEFGDAAVDDSGRAFEEADA